MDKQYTVNWENGRVIALQVDGLPYEHPDQIPDPQDRIAIQQLIAQGPETSFSGGLDDKHFSDFIDSRLRLGAEAAAFKLVFPILMAIALLLLGISAVLSIRTRQGLLMGSTAEGKVIELTQRQDDEGNALYYPVVEFPLADGQLQTVQVAEGSWPAAYEKGEMVTIHYDEDHPLRAHIHSASVNASRWLGSLITGTLGMTVLWITLTVRRILKEIK
ncbi:MAG: DUF3592 domain-containing protein [Cyanobacteria bacterium]|nr:DUF3592 domain-containing protein [Cyanobacteriota bacterium]MDA0866054.1 DUF3592 domain-containing protein [Cyanobacteriota bacterium]